MSLFKDLDLKYPTYEPTKKEVDRHIIFKTEVAEDLNKIVSAINQEKNIKANSSIVIEMAFKYYIEHLEALTTEEAIRELKKDLIKTIMR